MTKMTSAPRKKSASQERRSRDLVLQKPHLDLVLDLLSSGGDAIFVYPLSAEPPRRLLSEVNEAASKRTGYSRDELLSMTFADLLPHECEPAFGTMIGELRRNGRAAFETEIETRDGSRISVVVNSQKFELDGRPMVISKARDLSERKRVEGELRKLSRVVTQSPAVVMITDVNADIEYVNPKFEESTGFTAAEAIGKTPRIIQSGLHTREFYTGMWECLLAGRPWSGELCNRKKNGELYWEAAAISPVRGAAGEVTHFVAVKEDITERKRLEAALRLAKEAAEAANRAKSTFLANMSHEIRTPMNAILGFTQLMQRDPALTTQQKQYLDTIGRSGEHLLGLINSVLEMSKIESGRITVNPTAFDLPDLVDDVETMFRSRIEVKGLRFIVERENVLPRNVAADEGKLRQVLINLLGNAVKFTEKGGIALRVATSLDSQCGLRLRVEVEDTGPGIAEEEMSHLFRHFEQTQTGRRSGTGTGLGLAISREYVRLMGGELTARSQPGEGSLFRFEIRLREAEKPETPVRHPSQQVVRLKPTGRKPCVLVADDVDDDRRLLVETLETVGFETLQAANGEEAVRLYAADRPDLIIMDVGMPVMDGHKAIRRIRSTATGKSVPIISITANVFSENRKDVLGAGADEFLSKPFLGADLYEMIGRLLRLDYEYAGEPEHRTAPPDGAPASSPGADIPARIPPNLAARMREATLSGNMEGLQDLLDVLAKHDSALAAEMRGLADHYDYELLIRWLTPKS